MREPCPLQDREIASSDTDTLASGKGLPGRQAIVGCTPRELDVALEIA